MISWYLRIWLTSSP